MPNRGYKGKYLGDTFRVWCPRCGFPYMTAAVNQAAVGGTPDRPTLPCSVKDMCDARVKRRRLRAKRFGK